MNNTIYNSIVKAARGKKIVTYSHLAEEDGLDLSNDSDRNRLSQDLREIAIHEQESGRPMLTSLVIHKSGDNDPGEGFFSIATDLGLFGGSRRTEERALFWINQVSATHNYWAKKFE